MRITVWLLTIINLLFGANNFLNAVGLLQSSKYARSTNIFAAVLFLGMGAYGAYTAWTGGRLKLALWTGLGPWLIGLVVMFFTMILSNPQ